MLLSTNKIVQIVIFISVFSGVFVVGKLPIWIALTALLLPVLILNVLFNIPRINGHFLTFTIVLIIVSILNFQAIHLTTLLYSLFLCCVLLFSKRKIEQCETKYLIRIYRNVVVVYFALILFGLFLHYVFGVNEFLFAKVDLSRNFPRSFGPSTEPSYSALIMTIAMWIICSSNSIQALHFRFLLFIYVVSIVLIGSGIGFLSCSILLVYLLTLSKVKIFKIEKLIVVTLSLAIIPFLSFEIERLKPLVDVLGDFLIKGSVWDLFDAIKYADSSAWFRFGPFIEYIRDLELSQINGFLFGNGAGTSTAYFGEKYIMHLDPEWFGPDGKPNMDLPFFPAFLYDYGVIASLILLAFIWKLMKTNKGFIFLIPIALFVLFNSNLNTSIFWFFIYSLITMNILQRRDDLVEKI